MIAYSHGHLSNHDSRFIRTSCHCCLQSGWQQLIIGILMIVTGHEATLVVHRQTTQCCSARMTNYAVLLWWYVSILAASLVVYRHMTAMGTGDISSSRYLFVRARAALGSRGGTSVLGRQPGRQGAIQHKTTCNSMWGLFSGNGRAAGQRNTTWLRYQDKMAIHTLGSDQPLITRTIFL